MEVQQSRSRRLGYLVPEFPGQTHSFFWRELNLLPGVGLDACVLSTRLPKARIISHTWAEEWIRKTTYLVPLTPAELLQALTVLFRAGPARWWRCLQVSLLAPGSPLLVRVRSLGLVLAGARLGQIARRQGWTHVHVHSCADAATVALVAALLTGTTYSLTLHGDLEDYGGNQRHKWRHAAFVIVITTRLLAAARAQLKEAVPLRAVVAPMGVDVGTFQRLRSYEPWTGSGPVRIFSCGRLNPCKGHDDLIRAAGMLAAAGMDVHLTIAGEDDAEGAYRRTLETLIEEAGGPAKVTLLGAVSEGVIMGELQRAHAFVLASMQEPLGVALMEAMAMALPVVATRAGGVPELVDDGVDGLLVDVRQPAQIAAAVRRILADPTLARSLGDNGRAKIVRDFHSRRSAEALAAMVRGLE